MCPSCLAFITALMFQFCGWSLDYVFLPHQTVISMRIGFVSHWPTLGLHCLVLFLAHNRRSKNIYKRSDYMHFAFQMLPPSVTQLWSVLKVPQWWVLLLLQFSRWHPSLFSFSFLLHVLMVFPQEGLLEPLGMGLGEVSGMEKTCPGDSDSPPALQHQGRKILL